MAPSMLSGVDPWCPDLDDSQRRMLLSLAKARVDYLDQGRGREAHAVGKSMLIVWHFIRAVDLPLDLPPTNYGALS